MSHDGGVILVATRNQLYALVKMLQDDAQLVSTANREYQLEIG